MSRLQSGAAADTQEMIYYDLEATGLDKPQITQFAALGSNGTDVFMRYVRPTKPIEKHAQDMTGLKFTNGLMYLDGKQVESVSLNECMEQFIQYLGNRKVYLVGHYAHHFDGPLLLWSARKCNLLKQLREVVEGFIDTLPMFRALYPSLKGTALAPYSQRSLAKHFLLEPEEERHDALDDARTLRRLVQHAAPSTDRRRNATRSFQYILGHTHNYT